MVVKRSLSLFIFYFIALITSDAQDSLRITIQQADSLFLKNNLLLLASSMNVNAQKALIIQAKTYPNPVITADLNFYDPENKIPFHIGSSGQKVFQFEQLLILGGKRKSEIEIAKTNAELAELEFELLLLQLRNQLRTDLFSIGQLQQLLTIYNNQLGLINTLLSAFEKQSLLGNIPIKDVVRLKGAYLNLNNNRAELLKEYFHAQSRLQTLLQQSSIVVFNYNEQAFDNYIKIKSLDDLKDLASINHPQLKLIKQNNLLASQYFIYQKRLAIPDVNAFTSYDQRGGAFQNQINAGISFSLPIWNRNKGNITSAAYKQKESEFTLQAFQVKLESELQNAYEFYIQTVSEYKKATSMYSIDFELTLNGMTSNFQKQNISIIEFIDFFESYNQVVSELARIKTQLVVSAESLNLLTGTNLY